MAGTNIIKKHYNYLIELSMKLKTKFILTYVAGIVTGCIVFFVISCIIVANNPSTMNIMSKLSNLESQTSQMRFRMNDNQGSTNYITVHVGSVRSDDDIAEIKRTLENLALS